MSYNDTHSLSHTQNVLQLKATSQAGLQSIQDCLAMMNIEMGRASRGTSPSSTLANHDAQSLGPSSSTSQVQLGTTATNADNHTHLIRSMSASTHHRRDMQKRTSAIM